MLNRSETTGHGGQLRRSAIGCCPEGEFLYPVYAKLPRAPKKASPVPGLISLYHNAEAGPYGYRGYPGNGGGNLIRDLLLYFKPEGIVLYPLCVQAYNGSYVAFSIMWRSRSFGHIPITICASPQQFLPLQGTEEEDIQSAGKHD
jgi:hypothetical protein